MTLILAALAQSALSPRFSPPLVFPGEKFTVTFSRPVALSEARGLELRGKDIALEFGGFVPLRGEPTFLATALENGVAVDAMRVEVPLAQVPRWSAWPLQSTVSADVAYLISGSRRIALVPTREGFGLCVEEAGKERRWRDVVAFDAAIRYGPSRPRPFRADYLYAGASGITFTARPESVMKVSVRVGFAEVEVRVVAGYEMTGTVSVLGNRHFISLSQGGTGFYTAKF
jgi:hypothetical protein